MIQQQKHVSFRPEDEVFLVDALVHKDNRLHCWYSANDLAGITKERNLTLRLLSSNKPLPPQYTERGLEKYASMRKLQQIKMHQVAVVQAVLNEQSKQRQMGVVDEIGIYQIASATSVWCLQQAIDQGKSDHDELYSTRRRRKGATGVPIKHQKRLSHTSSLCKCLVSDPLQIVEPNKKQTTASTA